MKTLGAISETLQDASYSSGVQVDVKRGIYHFDCSGMVQWVLRKAAPRAARSAAFGLDHRPLARDFQRRIARSSIDSSPNGWRRIERMRDVKPGDVIAWIKPKVIRSPNTGHVLFVALPPKLAPGYDNAYLVRVIDSTRLLHDHDTRVGRSGFGLGTILIVTNPVTDAPVAYGWVGLRYRTFGTQIAIGRAER